MTAHECPRCGFESKHDAWYDRHPFAAVTFVVVVGFVVLSVTLAKPWFFLPLGVVAAALAVNRVARRRQAVAARANYEYQDQLARAVFGPVPQRYVLPPIHQPRRAADHSSTTQPITRRTR